MTEQELSRLIASLEHLKRPFERKQIGKIPASQGRPELDFVNHAHVVTRLNQYAPEWSYTVDETFEHQGKYWIRGTMTIYGASRVEYGMGKNPLEATSHFIRRAAMRFGVAADLWAKEDFEIIDERPGGTSPSPGTGTPPGNTSSGGSGEALPDGASEDEAAGDGGHTVDPAQAENAPSSAAPNLADPITNVTLNSLLDTYGTPGKAMTAAHKAGHKVTTLGALTEGDGLELIRAKAAA